MNGNKRKYGLFTAITMIIGTVIGSGIFFKSASVLEATGGSISKGVLVFIIAALAIIFGSLAISELASRTDKPGGIITYLEVFQSERMACAYGWFELLIHYPSTIAVVCWVIGIYFCTLFNLSGTLELQILIGMVWLIICFIFNTFASKVGGYFQNAATIIKLIPLVTIAIAGFIYGDPIGGMLKSSTSSLAGASLLSAVGPVAFSFDGWYASTFLAHDIKDSKRNLPLALIISPIIILIVYLFYFVGISTLIGPEKVVALGQAHVAEAASMLLGPLGTKLILIFVTISVMGTANGLIMAYARTPYSLGIRGMLPKENMLTSISKRYQMPINSCTLSFIISCIWIGIHYICSSSGILGSSDVSEIAIVSSYLLYLPLYYQVYLLYKKGQIKSKIKGIVTPILAALGSLVALLGGLQNPMFIFYLTFCIMLLIAAGAFYSKKSSQGLS